MKKCSSVVWRFFERIEENKRCVAVLCKLCETQYKYFGNTTNLRAHLTNKHPIQWELSQNGTLNASHFQIEEVVEESSSSTPKRRKYTPRRRKDKNVDVLENTDSDLDQEGNADINLVRQMHAEANSDEEWLEEDPYQFTHIETYEPKRKKMKYKKIKREVTSPTDLPGFYVAPKADRSIIYQDESPKKDEYCVFGQYVANKLRKFQTPRTRGNLQQLITTILWQAEYGLYDNAEAVKRVLMFPINTGSQETEPSSGTVEYEAHIDTVHEEVIEQDPKDIHIVQSGDGERIGVLN